MGFLDSAINYFTQNWVSIIFAIFLPLLFYYLSDRGIKKVIATRQEERLKIAKESITDVLEHQIINNSDINTDKIIHLLNATSRERRVNLSNEYAYLDLLEDLELRFVKSKHLKNEQREEYIGKIEILLKSIEDEKPAIMPSYEKVLNDLEESIDIGNTELIKQNLNFLKTKLILEKEKIKEPEFQLNQKTIPIFMSIIASLAFVFIGFYTNLLPETIFIIIIFIIIFIMLLYLLFDFNE